METLRHLRLYSIYSYHWPSTFRPHCRSAIYTLHMRALCLAPPRLDPRDPGALSKQVWRDEARRLASEMKVLLENTTEFPRAGEVNHRVLDFVDLCVAAWERGGFDEMDATWVIDVCRLPCFRFCLTSSHVTDSLVVDPAHVPLSSCHAPS